ncbi:unnamed protein product, partial [Ectocarpus fasciculatus]
CGSRWPASRRTRTRRRFSTGREKRSLRNRRSGLPLASWRRPRGSRTWWTRSSRWPSRP